jgi:hypothetical protein
MAIWANNPKHNSKVRKKSLLWRALVGNTTLRNSMANRLFIKLTPSDGSASGKCGIQIVGDVTPNVLHSITMGATSSLGLGRHSSRVD